MNPNTNYRQVDFLSYGYGLIVVAGGLIGYLKASISLKNNTYFN